MWNPDEWEQDKDGRWFCPTHPEYGTVTLRKGLSFADYCVQREAVPKRTVPKSVIVSRLTDKQLTDIRGLLTVRQEERWRAPNYPAVNHDDPDTIAVLRAVGADPKKILAP